MNAIGAIMPIVSAGGGVKDESPFWSVDITLDTALRASYAFTVFTGTPTEVGCGIARDEGVIRCARDSATNKYPSPSEFTGGNNNVGEESCVAGGGDLVPPTAAAT